MVGSHGSMLRDSRYPNRPARRIEQRYLPAARMAVTSSAPTPPAKHCGDLPQPTGPFSFRQNIGRCGATRTVLPGSLTTCVGCGARSIPKASSAIRLNAAQISTAESSLTPVLRNFPMIDTRAACFGSARFSTMAAGFARHRPRLLAQGFK